MSFHNVELEQDDFICSINLITPDNYLHTYDIPLNQNFNFSIKFENKMKKIFGHCIDLRDDICDSYSMYYEVPVVYYKVLKNLKDYVDESHICQNVLKNCREAYNNNYVNLSLYDEFGSRGILGFSVIQDQDIFSMVLDEDITLNKSRDVFFTYKAKDIILDKVNKIYFK